MTTPPELARRYGALVRRLAEDARDGRGAESLAEYRHRLAQVRQNTRMVLARRPGALDEAPAPDASALTTADSPRADLAGRLLTVARELAVATWQYDQAERAVVGGRAPGLIDPANAFDAARVDAEFFYDICVAEAALRDGVFDGADDDNREGRP